METIMKKNSNAFDILNVNILSKKILKIIDIFVPKLLINNYYSKYIKLSARDNIQEIIKLFIIFLPNVTYYRLLNFNDYITLFIKIKNNINYTTVYRMNENKIEMHKLYMLFYKSNYYMQNIIAIWEENNIPLNQLTELNVYSSHLSILNNNILNKQYSMSIYNKSMSTNYYSPNIDFIPISGGFYKTEHDKIFIKSFCISKDCISNSNYLEFVQHGGYCNDKLWSEEGLHWLHYHNVTKPKNWELVNGEWFIDSRPLVDVIDKPMSKISYFEAEAFSNSINGRLPTENEWKWAASNRNKTIYPWGITELDLFESNSNCDNTSTVSNVYYSSGISLLGLTHLFGNVWEWTSTTNDKGKNILKGGSWMTFSYIINYDLQFTLKAYQNIFYTGFRVVKNKYSS